MLVAKSERSVELRRSKMFVAAKSERSVELRRSGTVFFKFITLRLPVKISIEKPNP